MNNQLLLAIATVISFTATASTVMAAPLPNGTKLTIVKSTDESFVSSSPCPNGSCFGIFMFADLFIWAPLGPGTDGGLIIGKGQKSGGQEVNAQSSNNGELTELWRHTIDIGTFFTAPSDAGNVFDDQSCTGSGCGSNTTPRKTDLAVWNVAWRGFTIPLGSAAGCNRSITPACTDDEIAGIFVNSWNIDPVGAAPKKYELLYSTVIKGVDGAWFFENYPFKLKLVGEVISPPTHPRRLLARHRFTRPICLHLRPRLRPESN